MHLLFRWNGSLLLVGVLLLTLSEVHADEPIAVRVCQPSLEEIEETALFVGRLEASAVVHVRARTSGFLEKVLFKPGQRVKEGQLLFEIDSRTQRLALERAAARLRLAAMRRARFQAEVARAEKLHAAATISQEEVTRYRTDLAEAEASLVVAETEAAQAKLDLEATRITSPLDGIIGEAQVTVGNLVSAMDGKADVLATVLRTDLLYCSFNLDETTFRRWRRSLRERKLEMAPTSVSLYLGGDDRREARVDFVAPQIDEKTSTIRVRALVTNPEGTLLPGFSVRVTMEVGPTKKLLVVPLTAVHQRDGKASVVVVKEGLARSVPVSLGPVRAGVASIQSGLNAGDLVVIDVAASKAILERGATVSLTQVPRSEWLTR